MTFGGDGKLYIGTGDQLDPNTSQLLTSARGKILRIKPRADGDYTVPPGNLFPGGSGGRPEIYAMGLRNPFRFSLDSKTGWLYFGDAGPDADTSSAIRGPRGYDEINRAREAGNYGWPYCIADNKPYLDYQFDTGLSGPAFDCAAPTNDSPNNTGSFALPGAKAALIWYPYADSPEFPQLGAGSRTEAVHLGARRGLVAL